MKSMGRISQAWRGRAWAMLRVWDTVGNASESPLIVAPALEYSFCPLCYAVRESSSGYGWGYD